VSTTESVTRAPEVAPRFLNREVSWLAFNDRVLEEALDPTTPLIERFRFLTIFQTNLDEFFMIRVSGLKQQVRAGVDALSVDGKTPRAQLSDIRDALIPCIRDATQCLLDAVLPGLAAAGVRIRHYAELTPAQQVHLDSWYDAAVHPVLTPLATGPTQPFPFISNLSLNLGMYVRSPNGEERFARVKVPDTLQRLVSLTGDGTTPPTDFVPIEEIIAANLDKLFPGVDVDQPWVFRVTRDADFEIKEDEADDLLKVIEEELRKRRFGHSVRLEVQAGMPERVRSFLQHGLDLGENDVYEAPGFLDLPRFTRVLDVDLPEHRYPAFVPRTPLADTQERDLFAEMRAADILLHHPFDSFAPVVDFIAQAAEDPKVLAIKQTLYRTSGNSPIIAALEAAAENGKQVAAIVELKARFDEENNITWARRLEEAGVHVIYGVPGLKTHAKLALVIRQEEGMLRRYAHIGTGNYNPSTARIYTDLGLLTTSLDLTADVADLFNRMTGFARPLHYRKLLVAPRHMRARILEYIARERDLARAGTPAHIIVKCNAVTDTTVIAALYEASQAGVRIDLLVRGICCLLPGVPGLSETISVRSVVGRFLEHSRVFWFGGGGSPQVFIGSADWMDRNLKRRVEVLTPVEQPNLAKWLREVLLQRYLDDVGRTRVMLSDGSYRRLERVLGQPDVHDIFMRG